MNRVTVGFPTIFQYIYVFTLKKEHRQKLDKAPPIKIVAPGLIQVISSYKQKSDEIDYYELPNRVYELAYDTVYIYVAGDAPSIQLVLDMVMEEVDRIISQ